MRLLTIVLGAALLLPGARAAAQQLPELDMEQVVQREQRVWQDVKDKNVASFRAALDSSYTGLSHFGSFGMSLEAARYEWTTLDHYELADFVTRRLDVNSVLVTYKAQLKGKSIGLAVEGTYWMATIWKLQNGEWKAVFHAHVEE